MHRILIAAAALAALATPAMAEPRSLAGFDTVAASGRFRVEVAVGPEFQVRVDGPDAARIRTRVEGETLKIEPAHRPWFGNPEYDASVHVTLPRLSGVAAARGATLVALAGGECSDFSAAAAMGAELRVSELHCTAVEAAAAMGANLRLAGACESLDVAAAMGAVVEAGALHCSTVDASAAMGGNVEAFAESHYDASAAMGGAINVAGGGQARDRSAAMGGSVTHRE